ncbi:hypothetical protein [Maritimibacter sp. DP1N21-5]|uniref:hypothetical protein n=1 Tax=Maritimibacter sp. DP1N21-5 TaxID=2836867 RepID=UPI001C4660E7|nr:hypothetical protein [Maritimibacter sp. DP1N21-5]MBV7409765.1 hypothetical protein [Maritimibacter sp. DP1N21-5]
MPDRLHFLRSESGAVTVDWVVLTAAIVLMGGTTLASVAGGVGSVGTRVSEVLAALDVGAGKAEGADPETEGGSSGEDATETEEEPAEEQGEETEPETPSVPSYTAGDWTNWSGKYAGNYWGIGASQAGGNDALARQISLSAARADAPAGFNLDNPLMSPGNNGVVYTSMDGNFYSANGYVAARAADGSYVDQWGTRRTVQAWAGN